MIADPAPALTPKLTATVPVLFSVEQPDAVHPAPAMMPATPLPDAEHPVTVAPSPTRIPAPLALLEAVHSEMVQSATPKMPSPLPLTPFTAAQHSEADPLTMMPCPPLVYAEQPATLVPCSPSVSSPKASDRGPTHARPGNFRANSLRSAAPDGPVDNTAPPGRRALRPCATSMARGPVRGTEASYKIDLVFEP